MGFQYKKYDLTVIDPRTNEPITSGVYVFVYDAGTKTLATIYQNEAGVAKTNPIPRATFTTQQKIDFYCAAATVDIFIADDKGNTAFVPSIAPTDHVIKLDKSGSMKCFVAPFVFNSGGTEVDTGLDFPLGATIHNALVEVVTTDATETLGVGLLSSETAGDADGILALVPTDNAGFIKPWSVTDTTTEDYISAPYFGALMGKGSAGTSAANDFGQHGGAGHTISGSNARSLVYIPSSSDTMAGYIYVYFRETR